MDLFITDYSKYSKKELMELYLRLDKEKEPELAHLLEEEMKLKLDEKSPERTKRRFKLPLFFDYSPKWRRDSPTTTILALSFFTMILSSVMSLTGLHNSFLYFFLNIIVFAGVVLTAFRSIAGMIMLVIFILYNLYRLFF